ncbi:MAG: ATP-binding protein [Candidatus Hodarchaeales archaeon]|jgi:ferredoxin
MQKVEIYRELQEHLDSLPVGFPATESGVELRLLKRLFNLEEARLALHMKWEFESATNIFKRVSEEIKTLVEVKNHLNDMAKKGAIMTTREGNVTLYSLALWIIGMYEFQVDNLSEEFIQDVSQFSAEGFNMELVKSATKTSQFRVIPVGKSFTQKSTIATYDKLRNVIENLSGPIALANCICRQRRDLEGNPCKLSDLREICMPIGNFAHHYIDQNLGKEINKQKALDLVNTAEEKGFVIQSSNSQEPSFFCLCCGDCCGILRGMKSLPRPIEFLNTNYYAVVDSDLCTGCETCLERCQMDALTIIDEISNVNRDRCIGCGLCVSTCPENAIQLMNTKELFIPPVNYRVLYDQISSDKVR